MTWGQVTIGGITFREETDGSQDASGALRIFGQESHPPRTKAHVEAAHHNVGQMGGLIVPVVFTDKGSLSGFYLVSDAGSDYHRWANGIVQTATWQATLERIGSDRDVEIESRVLAVPRLDELPGTQTATFWHAPAIGTATYYTGTTVPASSVTRDSADGPVKVYLGIPAGVSPRWTVPVENYLSGSSRIVLDTFRRIGRKFTPDHVIWEMNNGLVRVTPGAGGGFSVACWSAGDWRSVGVWRAWSSVDGYYTTAPDLEIVRNDPEETVVRLTYPASPGRTTVDLSLRRGARFVTGVVKRHSASELSIERTGGVPVSTVTGGMRQTTADADGNRFVAGSTRTVAVGVSGGAGTSYLWKNSPVTSFDFFVGHEVGTAPATGDAFADLFAQYLGSTGERVRVVPR